MKKALLCILDGFGLNPNPKGNAVFIAKKPNYDKLTAENPHSTLITYGEAVGLPEGQMGNSEVGHLNIGAGRVVEQWLLRISRALNGPFLDTSKAYTEFKAANRNASRIHLIGLYSDGGVHSHCDHLHLLLKRVRADFSGEIVLHLITDGRDTAPNSAQGQLKNLLQQLKSVVNCTIAGVSGRFYAMDRDKRWERTEKAFRAIACGDAPMVEDLSVQIQKSYEDKVTDEFIEPFLLDSRPIEKGDAVVFWNFREDRMRQIVNAICMPDFSGFERRFSPPAPSQVLCFTEYDHGFKLPFLFPILDIRNHLGEVISQQGLKQLRAAETEKYPHVTYFFNGGVEKEYPGEDRYLVPSPRDVKTYDLKPEMSAAGVTEAVVQAVLSDKYDFIVVNLANCDMVGHTGVLDAAVKAVETADYCLGKMYEAVSKMGWGMLVIADHGNAEMMINYDTGMPHTAHTTFPVPVVMVGVPGVTRLFDGSLCDIAPTILKMMGLTKPLEMTGTALF